MPVTGTATSSGNFRTANLAGLAGWGIFKSAGLAADNTYCYALFTNVTNANVGGGTPDCHLVRIPWATWTVAGSTLLRSFSRVTGAAQNFNALARRPSDGLLACRLAPGDLFTFDPANGYAETLLGASGSLPSTPLIGVAFDPADPTVLWHGGYSSTFRRWRIGTGDLGTSNWFFPTATIQATPDGRFIGAASWDVSNAPKGVVVFDPVSGAQQYPLGLRWLNTDRDGAGNANHTEGTLANRAAVSSVRDACMDLDGVIYACVQSSGHVLKRVSADGLTVDRVAAGTVTADANSHVCVSPDGTKVAVSAGEVIWRVT